jgi:hypothetical protein
MTGYERYLSMMVDWSGSFLIPLAADHHDALRQVIENNLFDLEGPRALDLPETDEGRFFKLMFYGFVEVEECFRTLQDMEIYLRRYPFGGTEITRVRYLRHQIGVYLNELYIFKSRLVAYLRIVERSYRNSKEAGSVKTSLKPLYKHIADGFDKIVKIRGLHVHKERYSDGELSRLGSLEFQERIGAPQILADYYRLEFRRIRRSWIRKAREINADVKIMFDFYCDSVHRVVTDSEGHIQYPTKATKT